MVRGKKNSEKKKCANKAFAALLILFCIYPLMVYAAATIVVQRPVNVPVESKFSTRFHPVDNVWKPHKGTDYSVNTGTNVNTMGPVTCRFQKHKKYPNNPVGTGFGRYATSVLTCDSGGAVEFLYAHLSQCTNGATSVKTGGAKGANGAGTSTGPHLHFEIHLPDGTRIDPEAAYGKNLCDPKVQRELIADAQAKLNGKAGGARPQAGGGGGASAPTNPTTDPPATTQPGTTTPPPVIITSPPPAGPPYEPRPYEEPITPGPFPPTTDQVVPGTTTDNELTGCSTEVWRAMVNQSVLQTRREMLVNERYIAKGDSVLAYSCFEDFYFYAGEKLGILSESKRWKNAQIDIIGRSVDINVYMGEYSLDGAIINAVDEALFYYLDSNFDHGWLGEINQSVTLADTTPNQPDEDEDGKGHQDEDGDFHEHSVSQYGYLCGKMNETWQMAKCMNVLDDPAFYRLEDLVGFDPRKFPQNYACTDSGIFNSMINNARHEKVKKETFTAYFDILRPDVGEEQCAPPFPTGVTVTVRTGSTRLSREKSYDDALCITAGCTYKNSDMKGLGTCEIAGE